MQETVYRQYFNIRDVDELRERIVDSCNHLHQSVTDSAISLLSHATSGLCSRKKAGTLITYYILLHMMLHITHICNSNDCATFVLTVVKYMPMIC